jgi:hypothetical protein
MSQQSCDLALRYVEQLGFALLPLQPRGKEPHFRLLKAVHGTPSWKGLREQRASAGDVQEWFRIDPEANIGVITGGASGGLVVFDFDRRPNLRLGETAIARTGRGMHVYLRGDIRSLRSNANGCEIKGEGGYVVAPPSIHGSGTPYWWMIAPNGFGNVFLPEAALADLSDYGLGPALTLDQGQSEEHRNTDVYVHLCSPDTRLADWDRSLEFATDVARLVGIDFKVLGKPFRCVLPGHAENRPSAALIRESQHGTIVYHDLHRADGHPVFTLTEIYAAATSGVVTKLSGRIHAVWKRRLLRDLGLLEPYQLPIRPLPANAPANAVRWYDAFLGLCAVRGEGQIEEGVPFTANFAKAWCGLTPNQAVKGKGWLIKNGFIHQVGKHDRMGLWLPTSFAPASTAASGNPVRMTKKPQTPGADGGKP